MASNYLSFVGFSVQTQHKMNTSPQTILWGRKQQRAKPTRYCEKFFSGDIDREILEEDMATHSNILAGQSHEQRSMIGHSPWGRKESGTT